MAGRKRKDQSKQHQQPKHQTLEDDDDSVFIPKKRSRPPKSHKSHQTQEKLIDSNLTSKIIKKALTQQKEILDEDHGNNSAPLAAPFSSIAKIPNSATTNCDDDDDDDIDGFVDFSETHCLYGGGVQEINEEDEKVLAAFMSKDSGPQLTLADIIIQNIKEKDAAITEARQLPQSDNDMIDLFKDVAEVLSRYTNGKIPKAFKFIPALELWEDVLYLTEPENWSPNAMFQATRIFSSNLSEEKAQRFYKHVLLPRIRADIRKNKRLHFDLYQSLKKSLYKPAAFNKGILLPLCQSGTCSLREAVIVGSIIQKVSIPTHHSSAALVQLAEMDYCGTTSYFIKLFMDKKYALPFRALDAVVAHFMRFLRDERLMPVIWHQSLLAFVQRYKNGLTRADKDNLERLLQCQKHHLVTPEIRRELKNSRNRGEKEVDLISMSSPSCVINKPIEEDRWDYPEVPMEED